MDADDPTCVYQYHDADGRILYVGITSRGVTRSHEHARSKRWWDQTTGCHIEHFATRTEALARESYLIAAYKPPYNTQGVTRTVSAHEVRTARGTLGGAVDPKWADTADYQAVIEAVDNGEHRTAIGLWHALPKRSKRLMSALGCIACRNRAPVQGQPMCRPCYTAYVGGMTLVVRREMADKTKQA